MAFRNLPIHLSLGPCTIIFHSTKLASILDRICNETIVPTLETILNASDDFKVTDNEIHLAVTLEASDVIARLSGET